MKKQLVIIGIVVIFVSVGLSGCNSTNVLEQTQKDKLIGTWVNTQNEDETYTFYRNGSVYSLILPNNGWTDYSIAENELIINNNVYEFTFSDDNQKLILNGNEIWQRQ